LLAAAALLVRSGPATAAGDAPFTAAQAARGQAAFGQKCASCHGANLQGVSAPPLGGKTSAVAHQSVAEAFAYISQQMPMTAPGSLSSAQYVNILAYLLQRNGRRPESRPLTTATAKTSTAEVGAP
jgi:polar amino acid transport system substrate-binding protein